MANLALNYEIPNTFLLTDRRWRKEKVALPKPPNVFKSDII
jgi:hypothetical protein